MNELEVQYTAVDGPLARVFLPMFFGAFAAWGLWFLYLMVVHPPSVLGGVVLAGVVLTALTWFMGWVALRCAVISWRSTRGRWWPRLSHNGFEVNGRILRPRRYRWRDIDKFMLVAPSQEIEHAVVAPAIGFAEAGNNGARVPVYRVGFAYSDGRRSLACRLFANLSGRDGTKAAGTVMGYWDRPFDQAVDLMNQWHWRYRAGS